MGVRGVLFGLSVVLAFPAAAIAAASPQAPTGAVRADDGHPSFDGVWTNVCITPLERDKAYGTRLIPTPAEIAKVEGAAVQRFEEGNKPTDPNQDALDHTSKKCDSANGLDCGYNSFWKDSGTAFARVDGQPRTSFITATPPTATSRRAWPPRRRCVPRAGPGRGGQPGGPRARANAASPPSAIAPGR